MEEVIIDKINELRELMEKALEKLSVLVEEKKTVDAIPQYLNVKCEICREEQDVPKDGGIVLYTCRECGNEF